MPDRPTPSREGDRLLNVTVLTALAVAMPLCELFRLYPEFLWSHGLGVIGVVILVAGLLILPPLPLVFLSAVERILGKPIGPLTLVAIGLPSLALAMQVLVRLGAAGWLAILGAVVFGVGLSFLYRQRPALRRYVAWGALVALVAPSRLIWSVATADGGRDGAEVEYGRTGNRAPIVFVVFDGLPMASLLTRDGAWDERNFPNFARLAARAHTFTRASTVSEATLVALPAMLTAEEPPPRQAPTLAKFPRNLFTLFGGDHRVWAAEPATELCPAALNESDDAGRKFDSLGLGSDLWVIWRTLTVPEPWAEDLPEIGTTWRDFAGRPPRGPSPGPASPVGQAGQGGQSGQAQSGAVRRKTGKGIQDEFRRHYDQLRVQTMDWPARRPGIFGRWVAAIGPAEAMAGPELHFLHTMLPHEPLIYLPSGERYSDGPPGPLGQGPIWSEEVETVAVAYQRHLLQASFADRLLGTLLDRLEETERFDRSLIVVTADHGESFRPGASRRGTEGATQGENWWVPLLIKAPGQQAPEAHHTPVATTSVVPTMLDLLDVEPSWDLASPSALDTQDLREFEFPAGADEVLAWKTSIFGPELDLEPPLRLNRHSDLVGRRTDSLPAGGKTGIRLMKLEPDGVLENRPGTGMSPVWVTGALRLRNSTLRKSSTGCCDLVFAVGGRVVAAQRTHPTANKKVVRFQVLLPPSSLAPGSNRLEVFVVAERGGKRRLVVPRR